MKNNIKILVVDDHQLLIDGIISSLEASGYTNVLSTTNCDIALKTIIEDSKTDNPFDILFTDLSFDNATMLQKIKNGESLIKAVKKANIPIKIGVITGHTETNKVFNIVSNLDPLAYILKSKCDSNELGFAVNKMMNNENFYTHEIHQKLMKRNVAAILMDDVAIQILEELPNHPKISNLEGIVKKENGDILKLRSIENKLSNLRIDLNANNNTDLVLKAKELGIID